MCRSITTASGDSSSASSMAASPSAAVPTTASWGWRLMRGESASRNGWSSSASSTLIITAASAFRIAWEVSLVAVSSQPRRQRVAVIGAALDLGAGRRGVDMGPSAIRYAGLANRIGELGHEYADWGNVETAVAEASSVGDEHARFLPQIKDTCERIARFVTQAVQQRYVPLVLGGDRFREEGWGLPALAPGRVALVGVRSLDDGERALLRDLDARLFTMSDVDRLGVERAVREALAHVAGAGFVHVSLDMDALDPDVAPGVGTPVRGGLSYREAHLALELVAESGLATSLDVVEVNPILDRENETGKLAVELIASALGARIL